MGLGGGAFALMLELARRDRVRYVTSRACLVEARRNLERKRPDHALDDAREPIAAADVDPTGSRLGAERQSSLSYRGSCRTMFGTRGRRWSNLHEQQATLEVSGC